MTLPSKQSTCQGIFDPFYTFCAHAAATARKASRRLNVLRAVADTTFGHDKECLTATFKGLIRPFFDYAAPIVFPNYSPTSIKRLQLVQNKALRLITGSHLAASVDHLHDETQILPVEQHLRLLASQHLAKTLHPSHPSHGLVSTPAPSATRRMKETLRTKCWSTVEPFLSNGALPPGELGNVIAGVHTRVVEEAMAAMENNRVLQTRPPTIDKSESFLSRPIRTTLSQLRSGHCSRLNDFRFRIGAAVSDRCLDCDRATSSTSHLFDCPAHPTNLTTRDLWEKPWDAAAFIVGLPAFSDLPDPGPPPPPPRARRRARPPPEPPPSSSGDSSFSTLSLNSSLGEESG